MRRLVPALLIFVATTFATIPAEGDSARRIADHHYFGCQSEDFFGKLISYIVDGDREAFRDALAAAVLLGECTLFEKGETVYVVDTRIFSGRVKVRRRGETLEYWSVSEAVR